MTWYRTGTAAFTNGNATVTGTGTAWIANASIGEGLIAPDGRIYEITAIASDTSLTISPAYLGSTASGQAYAVAPIRGRIAQLLSETSSLLASFATVRDGIGSGLFPNGTVSAPALRAAADQDTGLFFPAANTLAMATGGAERVRVTSAGNVGIGTSSPGARLHVNSASALTAIFNATSAPYISLRENGVEGLYVQTASNAAYFWNTLNGPTLFGTNNTERMRIDSSGNVGIGVIPGHKLHVETPASGAGAVFRYTAGTYNPGLFISTIEASSVCDINATGSTSNNNLSFSISGSERMRITSGGNVGIGTTSPSQKLDVANGWINVTSGFGIQFGGTANRLFASNTSNFMAFDTNSTERMRIDSGGRVGIGTTSPNAKLDVASATGTASPTPTTLNISTTSNGSDWSDANPWGRLAFYSADGSGGGGKPHVTLDAVASNTIGASSSFTISTTSESTNTLTERMRITSGGRVGIGLTSPGTKLHVSGDVRAENGRFLATRGDAAAPAYRFHDDGDTGMFNLATDILGFSTAGSERMRITSTGTVHPGADNTQSLGEASFRWSTVFAGTGTINTSDEREKVWRGAMTEAEMRAAKRLLAELGMFQFTDSVEEKGEDARLHFGVRAQKAFAILEDEGLEWWRYAWCCHDKWDEVTEPVMEEVTVEKTRTVEKPVTVEKTRTVEVPEEREIEKTETVMEPVFDEETGEQVMDENGEPVMTEIEQTFTVTETVMVEVEETYEETVFEDVEETYEETEQRDTGEVRVVREAGDRYGIRADQLAYWLIAAQAEIQNDLDARLAKLEAAQ